MAFSLGSLVFTLVMFCLSSNAERFRFFFLNFRRNYCFIGKVKQKIAFQLYFHHQIQMKKSSTYYDKTFKNQAKIKT